MLEWGVAMAQRHTIAPLARLVVRGWYSNYISSQIIWKPGWWCLWWCLLSQVEKIAKALRPNFMSYYSEKMARKHKSHTVLQYEWVPLLCPIFVDVATRAGTISLSGDWIEIAKKIVESRTAAEWRTVLLPVRQNLLNTGQALSDGVEVAW